jgi:hypothetical protein
MRSRGKLVALLAVFVAVGLVTGTGAFSTVEAQRTADVNVAGDSSALLGLEAGSSGLIQPSSNDEIEITLDGSNAGGVNVDAITYVDQSRFLTITNNGNRDNVEINMSYETPSNVGVYFVVSSQNTTTSNTLDEEIPNGDTVIDTTNKYPIRNNIVTLDSGQSVTVGIVIDTRGASTNVEIITGDITITAEAA